MKSKGAVSILASVIAAMVARTGTALAQTEILTFDNLSGVGSYNQYLPVPDGYGGLHWRNVLYIDGPAQTPNTGYVNGMVSPGNIAFNGAGNSAMVSDGFFNLNSVYLTAGWNDGLQVEVQGFAGAQLIYDNIYTVNTTGPRWFNFNYVGINLVAFISSGGVPHSGLGSFGEQFVMDNLSVTLIPEPSAFALAGLALTSLYTSNRRRRGIPMGEKSEPVG